MGSYDCLLIFPYFLRNDPTQKAQRSPLPPLGLMYIASSLREEGYKVSILDCTFMKPEEAEMVINHTPASYVGFYNAITMTENMLSLAKLAKERDLTVILGGPDPSLDPVKYLKHEEIDYVVVGEGEKVMVDLIRNLDRGSELMSIRGLAYRVGKERMVFTGSPIPIRDLDSLPFPARDLVDNESYKNVWIEDHGYTLASMFTGRGCPYACSFCSEPIGPFGRRYTARSPENIVDELEEVERKWRYDHVWMVDDVFTVNKKITRKVCELILERGINITWSCFTRADLVDQELLNFMYKAGCRLIYYGVESGSKKILDMMNRQMRLEKLIQGLKMTRRARIGIHAFFQIGFPGETYRTIKDTINLLKDVMPDTFSFTMSYPLPGTQLHAQVKAFIREMKEWRRPLENRSVFVTDISEGALRFAAWKASNEYYIYRRARAGQKAFKLIQPLFAKVTDGIMWLAIPRKEKSFWDDRWPRGSRSFLNDRCFLVKRPFPTLVNIRDGREEALTKPLPITSR